MSRLFELAHYINYINKNQMNKKLIFTIALSLSLSIIFAKPASLKGKVINNTKYTKIELQDLQYNVIESQNIGKDGSFVFNEKFNEFNFYLLVFEKGIFVVFFPEPGENTEMTIDINNLANPVILNSVHSQLYYEYSKKIETVKDISQKTDIVKSMVDKYPSSPTCIFFLGLLEPNKFGDYHEKLSSGLKKYESNEIVKDFITQTENMKKLKIGEQAPEIELENPDGTTIKLSSTKGNYVLIDFWASWCRPCRTENPNNVKLYKKYHDKGFEIYAVSLDKDRDSWLKAIESDSLTWIHVSDLQFWQSKGAKIYNVSGIPHTVLLDKEGKILDVGLRGQALKAKLEELFGE